MDDLVAIAARALAERDARIAALTQAADALLFELSVDPAPDPTGHVAQCAAALRVLLTPTAPQPYPCTSDQFTHDHHYPHGDEGERGDV